MQKRRFQNCNTFKQNADTACTRVFVFFPDKHNNLEVQKTLKEKFFDSLPESFSRVEYLQKAKELVVPGRTANKQIKSFCAKGILVNVQH